MANSFEQDLTKGNVWRLLFMFSMPFLASNIVQSCFNLADMIILGQFGGTNSLSGVSIGSSMMVILTTLATGLATGGTVAIGNYMGSNQKNRINNVISTLLLTLLSIGLFFMLFILLSSDTLLKLLKTPTESFAEAKNYLIICALGLVFIFGYNALSSIMRGLGDAKTPMVFIILACLINIILDLWLVAYLKLGSTGAAIATVFSQALSMILCIIYLKVKNFMFDFKPSSFSFNKDEFKIIIKTGLPIGIQSVATNFSFLLLSSFNNDLGGVNASAAVAIVMNFNGFAILPSLAVNAAATSIISQNAGKKDMKRVNQTINACLTMCIAISLIVFILVRIFPRDIFNLFGATEAVIACGIPYLMAFSFEYAGVPFIITYNAFQAGTGRGYIILIITLLSSFIFRIPVSYLLGYIFNWGIVGVAYGIPIATAVGAILSFIFYLVFKNKEVSFN